MFEDPRRTESVEKEPQVLLRVIIGRHGPKLSAEGEKNTKATYFDEHVRGGHADMDIDSQSEGLVRIASSKEQRAIDTAHIHYNELSGSSHRSKEWIPRKEGLSVPYQPGGETHDSRYAADFDAVVAMQSRLKQEIRAEIEKDMPDSDERSKEAELRNRIDMEVLKQMFADNKKKSADDKTFQVSTSELADTFAKRYAGFARHTGLLEQLHKNSADAGLQPDSEPFIQIDISHSFPVTSFLKEYLVFDDGVPAKDITPEEFFERTGGIIRESGSLELRYTIDEDDSLAISVHGNYDPEQSFAGTLDTAALAHLSPDRDKQRSI